MLGLVSVLLEGGAKGFFENPEFLIGVPLVALGALGALLILAPIDIRWPQAQREPEEPPWTGEPHPSAEAYVTVGLILAVITIVEVAVYYLDIVEGALLGILLVLSALKFILVALWFMHLQFDNPLFSTLFTGGLMLAGALFIVVIATLGASLV